MRIHKAKNGRWGVFKPSNMGATKWLASKRDAIRCARSHGLPVYLFGDDGRIQSMISS